MEKVKWAIAALVLLFLISFIIIKWSSHDRPDVEWEGPMGMTTVMNHDANGHIQKP